MPKGVYKRKIRPKKGITLTCIICGKSFYIRPYRKNTAKYCSRRCQINAKNGIPHTQEHRDKISKSNIGRIVSNDTREKIKKSLTKPKIKKFCLHCNKTIYVCKSRISKKFCSKKCANTFKKTQKLTADRIEKWHNGHKKWVQKIQIERTGNKFITKDGYIMLYMPFYENSYDNGYIKEHRYIIEQHLNRSLKKGEIVHHINGIKTDNRIENLQVISNSAHSTLHHSQRRSCFSFKYFIR